MDDVLPIGPFHAGALCGGLDNNTGLYRKAVLVRVWYNPLNDSSTGGVLCKTGGCTEQTPNTVGDSGASLALHWSDGGKKTAVDARKASQVPIPSSHLSPTSRRSMSRGWRCRNHSKAGARGSTTTS